MSMPHDTSSAPGDDAYARWRRLQEQADAQRDALFVSDAERDQVCRRLSAAFSEGRITSSELDERTSLALAARTYGDLENAMAGLEAPATPAHHRLAPAPPAGSRSIVPRLLFWMVGLFTSPFILIGGGLLLFGTDGGSRIAGIVVLVLFLPGLIALYRWAHPRR